MKKLKPVDVVIVGGGWTGLTMAKEITSRTGLSVVVLERGPAHKISEYASSMDEVDYSIRKKMMQNIAEETVTHRHSIKDQAVPVRQYGHFLPGTGVGGAGEHWTGITCRFPADTFNLATTLRERYGKSKLPEGLAVQDWTITWDEIEPYYWRVEQMMGTGGKAGNIRGQLLDGGNIFEGPRSHEYPNPPHKKTYQMSVFENAAREKGYHPYPTPAGTLTQDYKNPDGISRPACAYCGFCMLYGCMIGAKAQPSNLLLPILRRKRSFTLRPGCWARRVVHRDGQAEGVRYMDETGQEVMQPATIVIVASFTPNNSRLLLLSGIGDPYDPITGKGTLGKNFTHQFGGGGGGLLIFDKPLNGFMSAGGQSISFADFEGYNRLDAGAGILRGMNFFGGGGGGGKPIVSFGQIPPGEAPRNWGSEWKKASLKYHDRLGGRVAFSAEHLSYRQNFVDLDPTYTDKWGDPLLRTTMDWTDHEARQQVYGAKIAAELTQEMARVSGAKLVAGGSGGRAAFGRQFSRRYQTASYATTHIQGGAIMGKSPEHGVVNTWLQHWRMSNLWVIGASAFPQSGNTAPTATALALTYRSADALIDRYLKHPGPLA